MRGPEGKDLESVITCRANIRANLLGAELDVRGVTFMQQDSRVGACAQVAIWMGARHMHQRNRYNWLSVADITKLVSPTTEDESTSLPAGSEFLTSERMIRAVHEMGFQALCFKGNDIGEQLLPYVESGLPIILGLDIPVASIGRAVTVIGRVFSMIKTPTARPIDMLPLLLSTTIRRVPIKSFRAPRAPRRTMDFRPSIRSKSKHAAAPFISIFRIMASSRWCLCRFARFRQHERRK
jgi:hypothetical protein